LITIYFVQQECGDNSDDEKENFPDNLVMFFGFGWYRFRVRIDVRV
jgi:hypothetical protein